MDTNQAICIPYSSCSNPTVRIERENGPFYRYSTIERVDLLHVMMDPEWISEPTDFPVCPPPSSPNPLIEHKHNRTNTPINRRRSQISSIPVAFTRIERGFMEDPPLCTKQSGLQHSYIMTVNNRVTMRAVCCSVRVSRNLRHHL
jgi:hypothetical protein